MEMIYTSYDYVARKYVLTNLSIDFFCDLFSVIFSISVGDGQPAASPYEYNYLIIC